MQRTVVALSLAVVLGSGPPAVAVQNECADAVDEYNSAIEEVGSRLRRYSSCVESSRGSDDCDYEFRRLRSAQDDFASAVGSYQADCD